jgi:thioredoxin 1
MSTENLLILTKENFDTTVATGVALVDFWAAWCGPCRMVGPVIEELSADLAGKAKVCKVNVDDYQDLAVKFGVRSIPTVLVFKDGKEVERLVGVQSKSRYSDAVTAKL